MNNKESASEAADEEGKYAQVPADFPKPVLLGAVGGAQPKLLLSTYKGKFYLPGCTPPQLYERWDNCEGLAKHIYTRSLESKAGKRAHMSEVEILDQYFIRLVATKWTSEAEARWVIRRAAEMLSWPVPEGAMEPEGSDPSQ